MHFWRVFVYLLIINSCSVKLEATTMIYFFNDSISLNALPTTPTFDNLQTETIQSWELAMDETPMQDNIAQLLKYKVTHQLDDWMYYQLVRATANYFVPKQSNYNGYTAIKWYILNRSGFSAILAPHVNQLVLFIYSTDQVYGLPFFENGNQTYICLNYHDFSKFDVQQNPLYEIPSVVKSIGLPFSYAITQMPTLPSQQYFEKNIQFEYNQTAYRYTLRGNSYVQDIFKNYPVVNCSLYFNIPVSSSLSETLIPALKKNIAHLSQSAGINYLLQFTQQAFAYKSDQEVFGTEKRFSPELTLLNPYSDCDDRVGLFYYLVREIYQLPMIAIQYPTHIVMAVAIQKPIGNTITYQGKVYAICDPTPQVKSYQVGEIAHQYKHQPYQIVYAYQP